MTNAGLFKTWATVLAAILASILLSVAAFTTGAGAQEQTPCTGKKVVLDPGHGGGDLGAINQISPTVQLKEKEQNLLVADGLATLLRGDGCLVELTRTDNDTHLTNTQ